jgi:hypothetical protein
VDSIFKPLSRVECSPVSVLLQIIHHNISVGLTNTNTARHAAGVGQTRARVWFGGRTGMTGGAHVSAAAGGRMRTQAALGRKANWAAKVRGRCAAMQR